MDGWLVGLYRWRRGRRGRTQTGCWDGGVVTGLLASNLFHTFSIRFKKLYVCEGCEGKIQDEFKKGNKKNHRATPNLNLKSNGKKVISYFYSIFFVSRIFHFLSWWTGLLHSYVMGSGGYMWWTRNKSLVFLFWFAVISSDSQYLVLRPPLSWRQWY